MGLDRKKGISSYKVMQFIKNSPLRRFYEPKRLAEYANDPKKFEEDQNQYIHEQISTPKDSSWTYRLDGVGGLHHSTYQAPLGRSLDSTQSKTPSSGSSSDPSIGDPTPNSVENPETGLTPAEREERRSWKYDFWKTEKEKEKAGGIYDLQLKIQRQLLFGKHGDFEEMDKAMKAAKDSAARAAKERTQEGRSIREQGVDSIQRDDGTVKRPHMVTDAEEREVLYHPPTSPFS